MTPEELAELVHQVDEKVLEAQQEVQQLLSTTRQHKLDCDKQIASARELLDSSRERLKNYQV